MGHEHAGAFSADCFDCQVWADSVDPDLPRSYRSNIPRGGRVTPRASRIIGEGLHPRACRCSACIGTKLRIKFRLLTWLARQFWEWTPAGQALYWAFALYLTHLYS